MSQLIALWQDLQDLQDLQDTTVLLYILFEQIKFHVKLNVVNIDQSAVPVAHSRSRSSIYMVDGVLNTPNVTWLNMAHSVGQ